MNTQIDAALFTNDHPDLYGQDAVFTIFYDESNNIRKFENREDGFNVTKYDNFVLGGVFLKAEQKLPPSAELRDLLRIQKTAKEIHFGLLAKGDFEAVLSSKKITHFFSWLIEHDINIHYAHLNILHWSFLDIIESLIAEEKFGAYLPFHREIKNELHHIVVSDLSNFRSMLHQYDYPNIAPERTKDFLGDVRRFIDRNWPYPANQATETLRELISLAHNSDIAELAFLVHEEPHILIKRFTNFYLSRICTFKNSVHRLDEEKEIQAEIENYSLMFNGREIDFQFIDSEVEFGIQLSDVVVGFLGRYFSFIEKMSLPTLLKKKAQFSDVQKNNLDLLSRLIDRSDRISNAFLFRTTSMDSDWKSDAFLHDKKVPPHLMHR